MSDRILTALMQLFAIIAPPESNVNERVSVVEAFLKLQLSIGQIQEYLKVFKRYYEVYQKKQSEKSKRNKRTSSSSVRVLKICTEINEELTQKQKIVVIILLLEFIKSENEITEQEIEFVTTVSDTFNFDRIFYRQIHDFVIQPIETIVENENIISIKNNRPEKNLQHNHKIIVAEGLQGIIRILNISAFGMYIFRYQGDSELYLNSQLIHTNKVYVLSNGAVIKNPIIRPIYFSDIVSAYKTDEKAEQIVFDVQNVNYFFSNGSSGLQYVNFKEQSGNLVGIMGASGTGKTTLLNVLNGSELPSSGEVLINNFNIHHDRKNLKGVIGYVAQDDMLIEELSVFDNLYFNGILCFKNLSKSDIVQKVTDLLQNLGLWEVKDMKVGSVLDKKISGGQRKRLNIALELIREPAVLFLDEPTSGLSSRDSVNIIDLLKELTLKGKLVFVVIHQPSSEIFKIFDKLLIMDQGGYMIYYGNPVESIVYFKSKMLQANWSESECRLCGNVNPDQIFNIIEAQVIDEYGNLTRNRKISPHEWSAYFKEYAIAKKEPEIKIDTKPQCLFEPPNRLAQLLVFIKRDVLAKLANPQYVFINVVETPLLAFLLSFIFRHFNISESNTLGYIFGDNVNAPVYLFISVIVAVFIGLTLTAQEIIKDRKIRKREAFLNLSRFSYLFSKIIILIVMAASMSLVYVLIGNSIIEIEGMYLTFWLILFLTWITAGVMGLIISDSFATTVTIHILIPFLVIPQIILSGIIVPFDKLNPTISNPDKIPWYGELIVSRWAYEALAVHQFKDNEYSKDFYIYDKAKSIAVYKKDNWLNVLENKLKFCETYLHDNSQKNVVEKNIQLIKNEIIAENEINEEVSLTNIEMLNSDNLSADRISLLKEYFNRLRVYYKRLYKVAEIKSAGILQQRIEEEVNTNDFMLLKKRNVNSRLAEIATKASETERIIEFNGRLYQNMDPIYQDPVRKLLMAHFYAPRKYILTNYFDTFWVNAVMIFLHFLMLFIILYYRLLFKFIHLGFYIVKSLSERLQKKKFLKNLLQKK